MPLPITIRVFLLMVFPLFMGSASGRCFAIGFAKGQLSPEWLDVGVVVNQLLVPRALACVAHQNGANQPVVANQQVVVSAGCNVLPDQGFGMLIGCLLATGKNGYAADLEPGGDFRRLVCRASGCSCQYACQGFCVLVTRLHKPIGFAVELAALANGENVCSAGL